MASPINLHPQRRRRREETEVVWQNQDQERGQEETGTSRYFERSTLPEDVEMIDKAMKTRVKVDSDEEESRESSTRKRMRQMRLDFSSGSMGTKKPFRNPLSRTDDARKALAEVAAETLMLLPGLMKTRPDVGIEGYLCQKETLDARFCQQLPPVTVRVISSDTIEAALKLQQQQTRTPGQQSRRKPVAILNMANANSAGGGWKHGALAQEEAICYRTSLIMTLKRKHYPIPDDAAIYSPQVLVIRDSIADGHDIVDCTEPKLLDVISVISCAAVCQPSLKKDPKTGLKDYALNKDVNLMTEKMRIILRTSIRNKHQQLVLGALGCGAFGNPNIRVASMWKAVLQEPEFCGGWWKDVVFAVLGDSKADSNFKVFYDELDGLVLR